MSILPVIDLMGGLVVRGVAGQRDQYRPVESVFSIDATPAAVAAGLVERFGFTDVYVADLDAIGGAAPDFEACEAVKAAGLKLMIDCGVTKPADCANLLADPQRSLIVGLESVSDADALSEFPSAVGPEAVVFSLDLQGGRPLTTLSRWAACPPLEIVDAVLEAGFRRLIVLDLASVGVRQGPTVAKLCRSIRRRHPQIELISGGGVRRLEDIQALCNSGCDRVLVASALHDGSLTRESLQALP